MALRLARHLLSAHPKIKRVHYPGWTHTRSTILRASKQRGPGAMLAFDLGSGCGAHDFLIKLKLCTRWPSSLGGGVAKQ